MVLLLPLLLPLLAIAARAAVAAAAAAANAPAPLDHDPSAATELTEQTFASHLRALPPQSRVLFLAYASWCGHCRAYMPHYLEAGRWLRKHTGGGGGEAGGEEGEGEGGDGEGGDGAEATPSTPRQNRQPQRVHPIKLDCASYDRVCSAFAVRSYPSIFAGTAAEVLAAFEEGKAAAAKAEAQEAAAAGGDKAGDDKAEAAAAVKADKIARADAADSKDDDEEEEEDKKPPSALAALRRFPGGGPKGDGAEASRAYRHDARGTVRWVAEAAFPADPAFPPDGPAWVFEEEEVKKVKEEEDKEEEEQKEEGGGGSADAAAAVPAAAGEKAAAAVAPAAVEGGWSLADVEAATLELWDQSLSAMAAADREEKEQEEEAEEGGSDGGGSSSSKSSPWPSPRDPWLASKAVLSLWSRAHPSPRCREGSAAALAALWGGGDGGGRSKKKPPPPPPPPPQLRAAASPSLQVCGPGAERAWSAAGRGARGGGAEPWERCRGSSPSARGFTCGLWVTWHACAARLAAAAAEEGAAAVTATMAAVPLLSEALDRFASALFRCRECAGHFGRMLREGVPAEGLPPLAEATAGGGGGSGSGGNAAAAAALWLWRAHDAANRRLARDESRRQAKGERWTASGDPSAPKVAWPAARQCPRCVVEGGGASGSASAAATADAARWLNHRAGSGSAYWDLDEVAAFVQRYYGAPGEGGGLGDKGGGGGGGAAVAVASFAAPPPPSSSSSSSSSWFVPMMMLLAAVVAAFVVSGRRSAGRARLGGGLRGPGAWPPPGSSGAAAARSGRGTGVGGSGLGLLRNGNPGRAY